MNNWAVAIAVILILSYFIIPTVQGPTIMSDEIIGPNFDMITAAAYMAIGAIGYVFVHEYTTAYQEKYGGAGRSQRSQRSQNTQTYILDSKLVGARDLPIDRSWKQLSAASRPSRVDFIFGLGDSSDPRLYRTAAALKFRFDSSEFTDKVLFHEHMSRLYPEAIAPTEEVTPASVIPPGAIMMVRANWGWKGLASGVATGTAGLQELYLKFTTSPKIPRGVAPRVIMSEYILDPMLFYPGTGNIGAPNSLQLNSHQSLDTSQPPPGYKFHVRVNVVAVILPTRRYAIMIPTVEIIPAAHAYIADDFANEHIHDTHDARNSTHGVLPADHPTYIRMTEMISSTFRHMLPLAKSYPEAENAYDIFGLDIMFTREGAPIILEINYRPGFDGDTEIVKKVRAEAVAAVFESGFADVFGNGCTRDKLCEV